MTESPCQVGYGRPPEHTRFRKGKSGNPGGKPGPKKRAKQAFDTAFSKALTGEKQAVRDWKPTRVIEALARKLTLDALDGRASAQRLVLSILDGDDCGGAEEAGMVEDQGETEESGVTAAKKPGDEADEESDEDEDEEIGEADRFVFEDEDARQFFGDRYDEVKARFESAVNANDIDALCDLAAEFGGAKFPASGNF